MSIGHLTLPGGGRVLVRQIEPEDREALVDALERPRRRQRARGVTVRTHARRGDPAVTIVR